MKDLRDYIVIKYADGVLPATQVCELSRLITACGICGLEDLAVLDPASQTFEKNASALVIRVFGIKDIEAGLAKVPLPMHAGDGVRGIVNCSMVSLEDALVSEFPEDPDLMVQMAVELDTVNWKEHEVRRQAEADGHVCIPYGLFIDGAAWRGKGAGTRSSVLSWYTNIIGVEQRRTICVLRKDEMCGEPCGCSCRGRCSAGLSCFERACADLKPAQQPTHLKSTLRCKRRREVPRVEC